MKKQLILPLLLFGGVMLSAQQLTSNIRLIPGGIEIIERENASTAAFDSTQRRKKNDQQVLIDFMDLMSTPKAKQLKQEKFSQSGEIPIGGADFRYAASAEKTAENSIRCTISLKRDTPAELKESFISIRMNSALLDTPVRLELCKEKAFWSNPLIYPRAHKGGWIWSSQKDCALRKVTVPLHRGELIISGVTAPAMACKYGTGTGNLRLYLKQGSVSEINAEFTVSYLPYEAETLNLRSAMNMGFKDDIPNDRKGGWTDQGPDNDLSMLTPGKRVFINVPFEVVDPASNNGKSAIVLGNPERPYFPKQVTVPVGGKKFRQLYFLHADAWPMKKEVGKIKINYQDGSSDLVPVVDRQDVANWWEPKSVRNAAVAWQGQNRNAFLGLYISRFPADIRKPIESLTLSSSGNSVWMIAAISGVRAEYIPFPEPDAEAVEVPVVMDPRDWQEFTMTVERKRRVAGSTLDFSFLLDAPAGKYGFVKSEGENFVFENRPGIPVRFNGGNLCNDIATRYTHQEADILADLMASYGFNAARLHHFDADLVDASKTDGSVDPKRLDNLHYLVAALKKRGIYTTIDLYTCRTKGFPEKFNGMFEVKSRMMFDKSMRDNLMNFARTMLTPVNPYTGLALKDDPALTTIGLINEDPMMTTHEQFKYPNTDPVQHGNIRENFAAWCQAQGITPPERPGLELYTRFLNEHQVKIYREMTAALRAMGIRQPTSDISCTNRSIYAFPRKEFDYVDNHYYFSHPRALGSAWSFPSSYVNAGMASVLYKNMTACFASRIKDKPFTVTEYNFCAPNEFRSEGGLAMGSLSAFQNASGIYVFDFAGYGHRTRWNSINETGAHLGWFGVMTDPVRNLSQRIITLLYMRGDVRQADAKNLKILTVTPLDYKKKTVQSYGYHRSETESDIPGKFHNLAFFTKIATDFADKVPVNGISLSSLESDLPLKVSGNGIYQPEKGRIVSSTGEISIDAASRTIKVVTPKSEGFLVTGKEMKGNRLSVSGSTGLCTVFASALDDKTLADTEKAVVFHLTDIQATGRRKTRLGDSFIVYNWGNMHPYLLKKSKAEISLKNSGKGKLRINALDVNGKVLASVPFKEENGVVTFTADSGLYSAMAYELIRK